MPPINLPINAGWKPDLSLADIMTVGGLKTALNIIRAKRYFWPVLSPQTYNANAMSGTPQAGLIAQASDGINYNFAATSTKLYAFNKASMIDATKAAGWVGGGSSWSFAVYGDWLIATNYVDAVQVLKGISQGLTGTKFADLGGTPPKAKYILMNHGHLILANLFSGATAYPKKMTWSARENVELYTASIVTGADSQECPEIDGVITGLAGVSDGWAVFSENSITVGFWVGGQYTFSLKYNVIRNIGCAFPGSLISIGNVCYFWSKKSIWMFDGSNITEIGADIKAAVFGMFNLGASDAMTTAHDATNNLIYWAFPTGSNTFPDKILVYNYAENVFTMIDLSTYFVMMAISGSSLSDDITTLSDSLNIPTESPFFRANFMQPMICGADNKMSTFSGAPLTATIETGEVNEADMTLSANRIYVPLEGESSSGTAYYKKRYSLSVPQVLSAGRPIRSDRFVDLRSSDRRLSVYASLSNFEKLGNTIDIYASKSGGR